MAKIAAVSLALSGMVPAAAQESPTAETVCQRTVDPQATREAIARADLDQAIMACTKAVEILPNDMKLRLLLLAAQEQLSYRRAINSREYEVSESYLLLFPNGRFVDDVRRHLASLSAAPAPAPGPGPAVAPAPAAPVAAPAPEPTIEPRDLARAIQLELKRVGCDPGAADGVWGSASQRALTSFNRYGNAQHAAAAPTLEMLQDLRARKERICPLVCRQGFKLSGETCVPIVCPTGQVANATGICVDAPAAPAVSSPPEPAPRPPETKPATRVFDNPTTGGLPTADCINPLANCYDPAARSAAANYWCNANGYARATAWKSGARSPTRFPQGEAMCPWPNCGGFLQITCEGLQ